VYQRLRGRVPQRHGTTVTGLPPVPAAIARRPVAQNQSDRRSCGGGRLTFRRG
jgi:hypothetical protein